MDETSESENLLPGGETPDAGRDELAHALIVRFFRRRWWRDVVDLLADDAEVSHFDDLDLDLDLAELRRAVSREALAGFVRMVLLGDPSERRRAIEACEAPESEAQRFLELIALNIAAFADAEGLRETLCEAVAAEPGRLEPATLGALLARNGPIAEGQALLTKHLDGAARDVAVAACVADRHSPDATLLHISADARTAEKMFRRHVEGDGLVGCRRTDDRALIRGFTLRRVGRFSTLALEGDGSLLERLVKGLSAKRADLEFLLVRPTGPESVLRFKSGKRSVVESGALDGEESEAIIGRLLRAGARVYDRAAPQAISTLSFAALPEATPRPRSLGWRKKVGDDDAAGAPGKPGGGRKRR